MTSQPPTIRLETPADVERFLALPVAERKGYTVWLGDNLPLWDHGCPRCDGQLSRANDSYGRDTYTKRYWCRACDWRDEQLSNEPTMAAIYAEVNRQRDVEARSRVTEQVAFDPIRELTVAEIAEVTAAPDDTEARRRFSGWLAQHGHRRLADTIELACSLPLPTHWEARYPGLPKPGWYGPIVALLGDLEPQLQHLQLRQGFPDLVGLDATTFLARGSDLFERAPIRCVYLRHAAPHLAEIFASPLAQRLVGLGLDITSETPIVDALRDAPALPRLRHLDIVHGPLFTLADLSVLASAPSLERAACLHLHTYALTDENNDDYITTYSLTQYARDIIALAQRTNRAWLYELVRRASHLTHRAPY